MLAGCGTASPPPKKAAEGESEQSFRQDPLRIGDNVKVELSGIPDIVQPSEQVIHEDGSIILSYVGRIPAAGKSPGQLEQEISKAYVPAYYTHISVTVTAMARYFYVGGQVNNIGPGRILYTGPITLLGAIQAAGDFNPFADRRHVQITRSDGKTILKVNCVKAIKHPELDVPIYPGDRIWVGRRF